MTLGKLCALLAGLLSGLASQGTVSTAQSTDRSAAFLVELTKVGWEINSKGQERLVVRQPSLLELVAYRFAKGSYRAEIMPAPAATGNTAADMLSSTSAGLVINGGYFNREADGSLKPTGLLIAAGQIIAPLTACRACSGVLSEMTGVGQFEIAWAKGYALATNVGSAVQTGPLLVEPGGKLGINKVGGPQAERSAICLRADAAIVVAVTSRITLHELATMLQAAPPGGFGCERAINLDGGPSTQIATTLFGKLETVGPGSSPVQNFIAFYGK